MDTAPPVTTDKWLRMLANELESKNFPRGYAPHLRHTAEILSTSEAQIFTLENTNMQLNEKLAQKEKDFEDLRRDAAVLWARYQKAVEVITKHDKELAVTLTAYRPRFHEIL